MSRHEGREVIGVRSYRASPEPYLSGLVVEIVVDQAVLRNTGGFDRCATTFMTSRSGACAMS